MNNKTKTILGVIAFALLLVAAVFFYNGLSKSVTPINISGQSSAKPDEEKTMAPDFTVVDKDGNEVKLSELIGKPMVLNFWASWCSPCKSEMPDFDAVCAELAGDVTFVMVDMVGGRETLESGKKHIEDNAFTFPVYYDTKQDAAAVYGVTSLPTTYFIDSDGYLVTGARGAISEKTLRDGIAMITGDSAS
ncbi:MAG: TlpA disulfide reductase family protein [Oscillospiraceae bacterium]